MRANGKAEKLVRRVKVESLVELRRPLCLDKICGLFCRCYWVLARNGFSVGLVQWRLQGRHEWKFLRSTLEARSIALAWQLEDLIGSRQG